MHQSMRFRGDERAGNLGGDFQGEERREEPIAADICFDGFAFDQFHRIETSASVGFAKMKNTSDVGMPQLRGGARFATKSLARLRVPRVAGADDF